MTQVRQFEHNRKRYRHIMDMNDDSITLVDADDKELVRYGAGCDVINVSSTPSIKIGRFVLENDFWIFKTDDGDVIKTIFTIDMVEGLLDAEVAVSQVWLDYYNKEQ